MPNWVRMWKGGQVSKSREGEETWWLNQMRNRVRYALRLNVTSDKQAEAELALFNRNPAGYKRQRDLERSPTSAPEPPPRQEGDDRLLLNGKLIADVVASMEKAKLHPRHIDDTERYLKAWMVALVNRDLRTLKLLDLKAALKSWKTAERNRIVAIKTLAGYLREEGLLARHEDGTLDLKLRKKRSIKDVPALRSKGYSLEDVQKVYGAITAVPKGGGDLDRMRDAVRALRQGEKAAVVAKKYGCGISTLWYWRNQLQEGAVPMTDAQSVRDVVLIRIKTGMHHSEIERIALGEHAIRELHAGSEIAAVVSVIHKSKYGHNQSVDLQTLAAIKRLCAKGRAPTKDHVNKVLSEAARSVGFARMNPGALRSTFVTAARTLGRKLSPLEGAGLPLHEISVLVGHRSLGTSRDHYDETKVAPMIVLPLRLEHPDDPVLPLAAGSGTPAPRQGPSSALVGASLGGGSWLGAPPPTFS